MIWGAASLFATKLLIRVVGPLVTIAVMRILGAAAYGDVAAAAALTTMIGALAEFGLGPALLKLLNQEKKPGRYLAAGFRFATHTAVLALVVTAAWMWAFHYSSLRFQLGIILSVNYFVTGFTVVCGAYLQHLGEYAYIAKVERNGSIINWTATLLLLLCRSDVRLLCLVPMVASAGFAFVQYGKKVLPELRQVTDHVGDGLILREASLFAAGNVLYQIYYQSDVVLLSLMTNASAVGHYAAAYKFISFAYTVTVTLFNDILYARYFDWRHKKPEMYERTYLLASKVVLIGGTLVFLVLYSFSRLIVAVLLGADYAPATQVLQVLAVAIPCRFLASSFGAILITSDLVPSRLRVQAVSAGVNVGLNLLLIQRVGVLGAALATVVSEALVMVGYGVLVHHKVFPRSLAWSLQLPVFASFLLVPVLNVLFHFSWFQLLLIELLWCICTSIYLIHKQYVTRSELIDWWKGVGR